MTSKPLQHSSSTPVRSNLPLERAGVVFFRWTGRLMPLIATLVIAACGGTGEPEAPAPDVVVTSTTTAQAPLGFRPTTPGDIDINNWIREMQVKARDEKREPPTPEQISDAISSRIRALSEGEKKERAKARFAVMQAQARLFDRARSTAASLQNARDRAAVSAEIEKLESLLKGKS